MTPLPVSVVLASRHRPALLMRALTALAQQDHPRMEVIVVADPKAAEDLRAREFPIKIVTFETANVALARNMGIERAGAPVVAFLDDDAVPEPTWASRLAAPFADDRVMQAGGHVRGRNGISFQWRAMAVDVTGRDHPLDLPDRVTLHAGSAERTIKTQGTNCAFRRSALLAVGGFDAAFRFYLDEADLNLRLAARGGLTAVVPGAQVHHAFASSARRRSDRAPLCLRDIGASTAIFLRRHAAGRIMKALADLRHAQRCRVLAAMQDGRLEPCDVARLMTTLEQGISEGLARPPSVLPPLAGGAAILPFRGTGPRPGKVIAGPAWHRRRLVSRATEAVAQNSIVTVMAFGLLPHRHRMQFDPAGYWIQSGGLSAASERSDARWRPWERNARVAREISRIAPLRPTKEHIGVECLTAQQHGGHAATRQAFFLMTDGSDNSSLDRCMPEAYDSHRPALPSAG